MVEQVKPGTGAGNSPAAPVASKPAPGGAGNPPAPVAAAQSVALFGGNRGGRARKDGFAPGSPEAVEANKKKDRDRKKRDRKEAAALVEPPALPSALSPPDGAMAPPPGSDVSGLPGTSDPPQIPWDPELLKPLVREAVNGTEAARVQTLRGLAQDAELPSKLIDIISEDAKYVPAFKHSLLLTAPNALTKLLNRTGISGKYSDETICALSMIAIWVHGKRVEAKLKKLIEENKAQPEPEKKP